MRLFYTFIFSFLFSLSGLADSSKSKCPLDRLSEIENSLFKDHVIPEEWGFSERKKILGSNQLKNDLTPFEEWQLRNEFKSDGRDVVIITDSHRGMRSGVTTVMDVLEKYIPRLTDDQVKVRLFDASQFPGLNLRYQDMRVGRIPKDQIPEMIRNAQAVHIALEGPMGYQMKKFLDANDIPYTTAYHTDRPSIVHTTAAKIFRELTENLRTRVSEMVERISKKQKIPKNLSEEFFLNLSMPLKTLVQKFLKNFHSQSQGVMVPTKTILEGLLDEGYDPGKLMTWSHGVELDLFRPELRNPKFFGENSGPVSLYVGRISQEKNLISFLEMKIPGKKVLVGDGPELEALRAKYPDALFMGRKDYLTELPEIMASSDVFVFPSTSDTFGLVQVEALASGTPVIGFDVQGPRDVIRSEKVGFLTPWDPKNQKQSIEGLENVWKKARTLSREDCRTYAESMSWKRSVLEFMHFLHRLPKN